MPLALVAISAIFAAAPVAAVADGVSTGSAAMDGLHCALDVSAQVVSGQPAILRMTLRNDGPRPLHVLVWGTPFEAQWFAPFVGVERGGVELPYGGAMVKRGDPSATDYVTIEPRQSLESRVDLAVAFDLKTAGHYRVVPRLTLHDVVDGPGKGPRSRSEHRARTLACNAPAFDVTR